MLSDEEFENRINSLPAGLQEYLRRWAKGHIAIRNGNWEAARKWFYLCMKPEIYDAAAKLRDQGIDLSGGFL